MIKNLLNRNLNKYTKIISEINLLENDFKALSDIELKECTFKLRKQYQKDNDLSNILTSSFALTRESSKRNLGLRHFDVQLLGGLVLNDGKNTESDKLTLMNYAKKVYGDFDTGFNPNAYNNFEVW